MDFSKTHADRKVKNYLILGLLLVFIISIFAVTIIKLYDAGDKLKVSAESKSE